MRLTRKRALEELQLFLGYPLDLQTVHERGVELRIPGQFRLLVVISLSALVLPACAAPPQLASGITGANQSSTRVPTPSLPNVSSTGQPSIWVPTSSSPGAIAASQPPNSTASSAPTPKGRLLLSPGTDVPAPPLLTPVSTAPLNWATPSPIRVHSLRLDHQVATSLALDQLYIYWTPAPDSGRILRYPLAGGEIETIATSHFNDAGDGYLGGYGLQRTGDWLIFTDMRQNTDTIWAVRALNVKTGQEQVVTEASLDRDPGASPDYMAEGDQMVLAQLVHPGNGKCDQSILMLANLRTAEKQELDRVCSVDHYLWAFPQLSGNKLIVEQDLPDIRGGGATSISSISRPASEPP